MVRKCCRTVFGVLRAPSSSSFSYRFQRSLYHQRHWEGLTSKYTSTDSKTTAARISFGRDVNKLIIKRLSSSDSSDVTSIILNDIGEGIKEVEIKAWHVNVGDIVREFDNICDVESDKATATITSRYDGIVTKIHYEVGVTAQVGQPLVDLRTTVGPSKDVLESNVGDGGSSVMKESENTLEEPVEEQTTVATLPSVRRLAKEHKVDLSRVKPTGKGGRIILKEDLLAYMDQGRNSVKITDKQSRVSKTPVDRTKISVREEKFTSGESDHMRGNRETTQPLQGIRKAMFKTMTQSLTIPHFGYSDEIDMTRLVEAAIESQARGEIKISQLAYFVKLVSLALLEYPELNASIDESGSHLTIKHYHNIGVAMDTKAGLVVPTIKDVQTLSILEVAGELNRLRDLGYNSKLGPEDLEGGTFTLSNIGSIGGIFGIPLIVPPMIVIGALGRTRELPRFNSKGQVEARHIMQLVWTADHRVVDGATLSRFTNLLKQYLERPETALVKLT